MFFFLWIFTDKIAHFNSQLNSHSIPVTPFTANKSISQPTKPPTHSKLPKPKQSPFAQAYYSNSYFFFLSCYCCLLQLFSQCSPVTQFLNSSPFKTSSPAAPGALKQQQLKTAVATTWLNRNRIVHNTPSKVVLVVAPATTTTSQSKSRWHYYYVWRCLSATITKTHPSIQCKLD